jgi:poly-gamma-glutamate capsule biosynthesis protein CapA/YwtB (metallophosphatase superfamily)|tara:strand:+ start:287 stop:451 length:165 start_codon:yes stop_codon:yes gene_type:complete
MKEKNMKYVITKSPAEINKDIDKLKNTSEWKSETRRFIKKAMKVISSWFNVKHS